VRKREETTLGYTPQVVAPVEANPKPTTQAYAKVPTTPKPPPATSPIEPSTPRLRFGALGPVMLFPAGVSAQHDNKYGL